MIYLSQLDNLIKHHLVLEYYERGVKGMCINEFLPLCAALLYPYKDEEFPKENKLKGNILPIIESIKSYTKKVKGLENYSLDGLRKYFQIRWLPVLEFTDQKNLIKCISLVDNVEDDRFFSLKGNDKVYQAYLKILVLDISGNYGSCAYEEESNFIHQTEENKYDLDDLLKKDDLEKIKCDLETYWLTCIYKEKYKELMPLVWKLDISQNEYIGFKQLLKQFVNALPENVRERNAYLDNYAEYFFVYVALWYRWEYQGRVKNALQDIDYPLSAMRIWKNCSESYQKYLYLAETEEYNTSWLNSLYVLGGFPLNYVCNAERRFSQLFKEINNPEIGEDEDMLNSLSESFDKNNSVYYRSLMDGSFREFVSDLINGDMHMAQEDEKIDIVQLFLEFLDKGKIEYFDDFFKIDWNFYIESSKSDCDCILNVNIGFKYNRCYIPEELLRRANVSDVEKLRDYYLYVDYNNGEKLSKPLRFSRIAGNGSPFVGWGSNNVISIPVVPNVGDMIIIKLVGINDIDQTNPYILKKFTVDGYFRLFKTNNPYEWSSLTDNKAHSVLLFNPSRYYLRHFEDSTEVINIGSWLLHYLYNDAQLEDIQTGEILDFKTKKGILCVEFKKLPNIIQYNKENEISYSFYHDEQISSESMPLMLGKDGISKVVFYPFEKGESPKTYVPEKNRNIVIKFKQDSYKYKNFEEERPHTGIISLCVSDGNHSVVKKCFYISNPSFVKRDLENSRFVFILSDAEVFQAEDEKLEFNKESDRIVFLEQKDYLPHLDYLTFRVGAKNDYANINVYRARECRELYFLDHRFTEFGNPNKNTKIPFILREKFRIRTIDSDGVKNVNCPRDIWMNPDVNLQNININPNYTSENYKTDSNNGIAYYQYLPKGTTIGHYMVSPRVFFKYKFFHWDMLGNSAPVPVKTEYNPDNKELVVKCDKLEDSCIVFQSLRDEQPYNYVRPLLPNGSWSLKINRIYKTEAILNCIEVASEHKVYFAMFYPIRNMVTKQKDLFTIFEKICERKSYTLKTDDYQNLHRFAHEFCFEWILLSRNNWKRLYRNERLSKIIEELFRTTPFVRKEKDYIERVIELYFGELNMEFRRDNNTAAGVVMQCVRSKRGDKQFFVDDDYPIRIERLESIYQDTSICYHLYQKLNELQ